MIGVSDGREKGSACQTEPVEIAEVCGRLQYYRRACAAVRAIGHGPAGVRLAMEADAAHATRA